MPDFDLIIGHRDRGRDPNRVANLVSAISWWRDAGIEPIIVDDGRTGDAQWCRHAAYNRGAQQSTADVLVYSEADMLLDPAQVLEGVRLASSAPGLVVPFSKFMEMSESDSILVRARQIPPGEAQARQVRGECRSIGAVNIVSRETLATIGRFDEGYSGHAFDDDATEYAFRICTGRATRFVHGPAWHQWHVPGAFYATPESTQADRAATAANKQRYQRYLQAHTPDQVRALTTGGE